MHPIGRSCNSLDACIDNPIKDKVTRTVIKIVCVFCLLFCAAAFSLDHIIKRLLFRKQKFFYILPLSNISVVACEDYKGHSPTLKLVGSKTRVRRIPLLSGTHIPLFRSSFYSRQMEKCPFDWNRIMMMHVTSKHDISEVFSDDVVFFESNFRHLNVMLNLR